VPLGLLLLALTGIGPLIAWRRASVANIRRQFIFPGLAGLSTGVALFALGMRDVYALICYALAGFVFGTIGQEFWKGTAARVRMYQENAAVALFRLVARNRRRYGGYIVHFGMVTMFAAFAGLAFKKDNDVTLKPGETFTTTDPWGHAWTFTSQGVSQFKTLNRYVTAVALDATRDGKRVGIIKSEKRQHVDSRDQPTFEPSTEVGIMETLRQDTYVVLAGVTGSDTAELRITFNPLVWWVWFGGIVMGIGGLIVMWPQAERRRNVQSGYVAVLAPGGEQAVRPEPRVRRGRGERAGRDRRAGAHAPAVRADARGRRGGDARGRARRRRGARAGAAVGRVQRGHGPERVPPGAPSAQAGRGAGAHRGAARRARAHAQVPVSVHARRVHVPHHRLQLRHLAPCTGCDVARGRRAHRDEIIARDRHVRRALVLMSPG
jgi:hypothetical protein